MTPKLTPREAQAVIRAAYALAAARVAEAVWLSARPIVWENPYPLNNGCAYYRRFAPCREGGVIVSRHWEPFSSEAVPASSWAPVNAYHFYPTVTVT